MAGAADFELGVLALLVHTINPVAKAKAGGEGDEAAHSVYPIVVTRDNDAQKCEERVGENGDTNPAATREGPNAKGTPCGPADVEAWHGGVLVGGFRHAARAEIPRATEFFESVDKAKRGGAVVVTHVGMDAGCAVSAIFRARGIEKAWGHEGKEGKTNDGEASHGSECVAKEGEHVFAATVENDEDTDRDGEVCGAVIGVHPLQEPFILKEPLLDGFFMKKTKGPFDAHHGDGVIERMERDVSALHIDRAEAITGEGVHEVERPHDGDFFPPPGAVCAHFVWCRSGG